ncbi:helix-turn-helix domain-containing protein [Uliginosibacterium sp. sgz301328]|uniref:helix-turn-helix domain-containing protein n=1 Tax=Uliginosibacterium sp. sgz301328 TaxID=3243764 RepID=UPI00359CD289
MILLRPEERFRSHRQTIAVEYCNPQGTFPEHSHDFDEIVLVQGGSGVHVLNDRPCSVGAGSVLWVRARDDRHAFEYVADLQLCNIHYRRNGHAGPLACLERHLPANATGHWQIGPTLCRRIEGLLARIGQCNDTTPAGACMREALLLQAVALMLEGLYHEDPQEDIEDRTHHLINYLRSNFQSPIDWSALSARYAMPLRTLHRRIKERTGLPPQSYVTHLRLAYACSLLRTTTLPVTYVAYECGAEDSNNFSTLFKKVYGIPPREYRRRCLLNAQDE